MGVLMLFINQECEQSLVYLLSTQEQSKDITPKGCVSVLRAEAGGKKDDLFF